MKQHTNIHAPASPLRRLMTAVGALALICMPALLAQVPQKKTLTAPKPKRERVHPTVPQANRHQPGKVFLEHADLLELDEKKSGGEYQILRGNVLFRKGDMFMSCDSAYFYEQSNSLDAFGNVKMEQGDTLFVFGDELNYNGQSDLARLIAKTGKKVRLINRDVTLTTDVFEYDLAQNVGYYLLGGVLTDRRNRLTSLEGYYYPASKDAFFYENVVLTGPRQNDTIKMYTDSLKYNTGTSVATLLCSTLIVNRDGEIRSSNGTYDTRTGLADLLSRSLVVTRRGNTLTGDTLIYNRLTGIGEAFGNMVLTDSTRQCTLTGNYGYYNDPIDSAFCTGNALAMEYSRKDTLYIHADSIEAYRLPDSTSVTNAYHRARFFRSDLQGLADSLSFVERDSMLYLYRHPIVWTGARQVHGNEIRVHFNDSTAEYVRLPRFGMMTEHIAEDCYNQLSGSDMTAWLNDTTVTRLYVEGNVQGIMFPMEQDSTYNKFTFFESSYLNGLFTNNEIDRISLWPETTGNVTPLYLAKKSSYFLPNFQWYSTLRPLAPDEVFDRPKDMELLMSMPEVGANDAADDNPQLIIPQP